MDPVGGIFMAETWCLDQPRLFRYRILEPVDQKLLLVVKGEDEEGCVQVIVVSSPTSTLRRPAHK